MAKRKNPPSLSKGRSLTDRQKINRAIKVCELYATDEHTLEQCLKSNGIKSFSTWHKWRQEIEEIEKLYNIAKHLKGEIYDYKIDERGKTTLEKWLTGFDYEEERIEYSQEGKGKVKKEVITKRVVTKKIVLPSLKAAIFAITNTDKLKFQKNPAPEKGEDTTFIFTGFRFVTPKDNKE